MSCGFSRVPSRATVCWRRLVSPVRASSCLGDRRRESGQSRVPTPPAMTMANIGLTVPPAPADRLGLAACLLLEALAELLGAAVRGPHRVRQDGAQATLLQLVDGGGAGAARRGDGV